MRNWWLWHHHIQNTTMNIIKRMITFNHDTVSWKKNETHTHTHTHTHVYMDSHLLTLFFSLTSAPFSIKYLTMSLRAPLSVALMSAISPSLYKNSYGIEYIRRIPSHLKSNYIINRIESSSCTMWPTVTNYTYTYRGR